MLTGEGGHRQETEVLLLLELGVGGSTGMGHLTGLHRPLRDVPHRRHSPRLAQPSDSGDRLVAPKCDLLRPQQTGTTRVMCWTVVV